MKKIAEGKTKQIWTQTFIIQKDDITAGDGARRHIIPGKGEIAARTTSNVFKYLNQCGVPTHYIGMESPNRMAVHHCEMIPLEVVIRRIATGSYIKRTGTPEGTILRPPIVEFFLKDDAKHDPFLTPEELAKYPYPIEKMTSIAHQTFVFLELAWEKLNVTLVDLKIEFGFCYENYVERCAELLVADVIDNDSWRLWPEGDKSKMLDKQVYRNLPVVADKDLETLLANYRQVADMTENFS